MKKFFVVLAFAALLVSCDKSTECKCTVELNGGPLEIKGKDIIVAKPEDTSCSEIKVEDIKGELGSLNLSKVATIKCVPYHSAE